MCRKPVIVYANVVLGDLLIGAITFQTAMAYITGTNDPKEVISAGVIVGMIATCCSLRQYKETQKTVTTYGWAEAFGSISQNRLALVYAEATNQKAEYNKGLLQYYETQCLRKRS